MIRTATCPIDLALQQYAEGWADPASTLAVEEHLAICSKCEERLSLIESDRAADGLIESLRLRGQLSAQRIEPATPTAMSDINSEDPGFQQVLAEIQAWSPEKPEVSDPDLDLPRSLGQYELLALIGQGGMAHVYRARHSKLQRTVAIKLLHVPKWQVDRSLARLEREIAVVGQLHHPAIVAATDAGQHDGTPYLVTEFIDGLNLSQLARAVPIGSTPNTADVCEVIRVAALGLAHAHSQGVTHRDIKPSNLMIDRQGHVKILDFGLVHLEGWQDEALELTTVGQLLGTLDYMAPEQADKATAVDHRSDIYALGATMFRLLCGRAPYAASLYQSPLEKLRLLAMTAPPKVETLRPDLPVELAELVNQSLNRDPAKRPPSAAHLAEALLPFCQEAKLGAWVQWALDHPPAPTVIDQPSPGPLHRPNQDLLPGKKSESATLSSGRGRRWWPWALTAAAGAAAMWLSIILILDTQKGQLVIESESADVRVTLRKDGQESETLQLEPGLNLSRVFAGTYQIEIDGPADAYQLDRNTIIIKRGEVVLAKVSRRMAVETPDDPRTIAPTDSSDAAAQTPQPAADEPTYKGHPFSYWAAIVRNERDHDLQVEAFKNLHFFHTSEIYRRKSREVWIEAIIESHQHRLGGIATILYSHSKDYKLHREDWQRIAASIAKCESLDQPSLLAQLHPLVCNSPIETGISESETGIVLYIEAINHVAEKNASHWTGEGKYRLWDAIIELEYFIATQERHDPNDNETLLENIRAMLKTSIRNCGFNWENIWGWAEYRYFLDHPFLCEVVIEILMREFPTEPAFDIQTAKKLALAQRLAQHMTVAQRQDVLSYLEKCLKNSTPSDLKTTFGKLFGEISFWTAQTKTWQTSDSKNIDRESILAVGLSFRAEMKAQNSLVVLPDRYRFEKATIPTIGDSEVNLWNTAPLTFGELITSTYVTLTQLQSNPSFTWIEQLIAQTRSDDETFWKTVKAYRIANPHCDQVILEPSGARITGTPKRAVSLATPSFMFHGPRPTISEWLRIVDEIWDELKLEPTATISSASEKEVYLNSLRSGQFTVSGKEDLDKDGQITKDEMFSFLSRCSQPQTLEGITPEIAHGMLLHRHLLTLLDRPLPKIEFADSTTESEPENEEAK